MRSMKRYQMSEKNSNSFDSAGPFPIFWDSSETFLEVLIVSILRDCFQLFGTHCIYIDRNISQIPAGSVEFNELRKELSYNLKTLRTKLKKEGMPLRPLFMFDLLIMLSACHAPLSVLDKQPFREFWNKHVPEMELPSHTTLCLLFTLANMCANSIGTHNGPGICD
ncbi:hypothetical protein NQ318_018533 [Aromia moschata]|uniref:Uncharacterized protein n=1 Tax=Aromia moschata TaxID=1265417 RepID=A0AAV8ZEX7_9CUCU|nr:hypothetical protein NQ318_018533 [Aromia moschata]